MPLATFTLTLRSVLPRARQSKASSFPLTSFCEAPRCHVHLARVLNCSCSARWPVGYGLSARASSSPTKLFQSVQTQRDSPSLCLPLPSYFTAERKHSIPEGWIQEGPVCSTPSKSFLTRILCLFLPLSQSIPIAGCQKTHSIFPQALLAPASSV